MKSPELWLRLLSNRPTMNETELALELDVSKVQDSKKTAGPRPGVGGLRSVRLGILDSVWAVGGLFRVELRLRIAGDSVFSPTNASSRAGGNPGLLFPAKPEFLASFRDYSILGDLLRPRTTTGSSSAGRKESTARMESKMTSE